MDQEGEGARELYDKEKKLGSRLRIVRCGQSTLLPESRTHNAFEGVKQGWLTVLRSLKMDIFTQTNKQLVELNWFGDRTDVAKPGFVPEKDVPPY